VSWERNLPQLPRK